MKKIFYFALLLMTTFVASCSKDEIGETATKSTAGQWYVTADYVDEDGTVYKDVYGIGPFLILTYNTSANNPNEIWVDDNANFWEFKVKAAADQNALTFSTNGEVENQIEDYPIAINITNGKVLPGAGKQKNGSPADSITFDIEFEDDPGTIYRLQGVRYSGLKEND